jgi:hypothetical protein
LRDYDFKIASMVSTRSKLSSSNCSSGVRAALARKQNEPWYRQIVGDLTQDKAFAEILRLGQLIRRGKLKE